MHKLTHTDEPLKPYEPATQVSRTIPGPGTYDITAAARAVEEGVSSTAGTFSKGDRGAALLAGAAGEAGHGPAMYNPLPLDWRSETGAKLGFKVRSEMELRDHSKRGEPGPQNYDVKATITLPNSGSAAFIESDRMPRRVSIFDDPEPGPAAYV